MSNQTLPTIQTPTLATIVADCWQILFLESADVYP